MKDLDYWPEPCPREMDAWTVDGCIARHQKAVRDCRERYETRSPDGGDLVSQLEI